MPIYQVYQNEPIPAPYYPSQDVLFQSPATFALEEPIPNDVNPLNELEPTLATYSSLQATPITPHSFTVTIPAVDPNKYSRKVTNNKKRHVPYNIPTKIHKRNKKPITFELIFVESKEEKRPIPKKYGIYIFCTLRIFVFN
jgi:hypothetical protein